MATITHKKVATAPDDPAVEVNKGEWNDTHNVSSIVNADIDSSASISESKIALNFPTHSNANDPTNDQAAAMDAAHTPSASNAFATMSDVVGGGTGNVIGPASATDNHLAVFDGTTGKLIKDGGAIPSGGSVAGSDTQIQFNDGGVAGANADLSFDKTLAALKVGQPGVYPNNPVAIGGGTTPPNGYLQLNIQNTSSGTASSSDLIATASNGSNTTHYVNMGISGGNWDNSGATAYAAGDGYIYSPDGSIRIQTDNASGEIDILIGGGNTEDSVCKITTTAIALNNLNITGVNEIYLLTDPTIGSYQLGKMFYDKKNLTLACCVGADSTLQIGQEHFIICYNATAYTLTNGKPVYITGSTRYEYATGLFGDYPNIDYAQADDAATSTYTKGLLTMDIAPGTIGLCTQFGVVNGLDTSAFSSGAAVYLSDETAGAIIPTAPTQPNKNIFLGNVLRSHATAGNILVHVLSHRTLTDQDDVLIVSPSVDQILKFNGTNWINGSSTTASAGSGVAFFYSEVASDISGYSIIDRAPDSNTEQDETAVCNNNKVLITAYASDSGGLGGTQIDSGNWDFEVYCYSSTAVGTNELILDVYKRTSGGTETLLFSVTTGDIDALTTTLVPVTTSQQAFSINATDRLVIKVSGQTDNVVDTTIHFIHSGTSHYSYVITPLVVRHNDLQGLQGGSGGEYYHLTSAQATVVSNTSNTNTGDQDLSGKVTGNTPITGATNTKITYDSKGLVTAGVAATTADIDDSTDRRYCTDAEKTVIGNTSNTNTGDQDLSGKVTANTAITGATNTKITYDSKGLVTAGVAATTADFADSTDKRFCTDAQKTVIGNTSGTNSGNETTTTIGSLINGSTLKDTPIDADRIGFADSAASFILKYFTFANLKTYLASYFTNNAGTVTSVTAGNGMTQSGTASIDPTLNIVSHAGTAGSIGTINIGADAIGVNLGETSTTACSGADSRLSDSRTPTAHNQDATTITTGVLAPDRLATGTGLQVVRRNTGNTALEFVTLAGGGDMLAANNLSDVASAQTSRNNILPSKTGNTLKVLRVNAGETDYELATATGGGITGDGIAKITVSTTEPTSPTVGDAWIDTN